MKNLKDLFPAYLLAAIISFMLYIYEPILTYSANIDDFWFDFKLMLPNIIMYFTFLFLGLVIIYTIIYIISKLITKKNTFYKIILAISYIGFIYIYIQGVYLIKNLPSLDGTTIYWNAYVKDTIISISIFVILSFAEFIFIKKFKFDKVLKINFFIAIVIFLMLLTSFVNTLFTPGIFKEKIIATASTRNINTASLNKNFFIFLVDAVDSTEFSEVLNENNKYSSTFDDFTYYPDTISGYLFTRDSIPFIFSGIWNENETEFSEYYNNAFNNSILLKKLKEEEYNMNFYEYQIHWSDRNAEIFSNIDIYNDKVDKTKFFKQLSKYVLFKYLPYPLKQYSRIESADFDSCKVDNEKETYFSWRNDVAYTNIKNNDLDITDDNYFQFIHIEGGHTPFDYDENVNIIPEEEGTYKQKLAATLNIIDAFISRLKEHGVYDNSVIIIMADHGYGSHGRQNPILYIKGLNEHHEMNTSEIPVSYEDLCDAYLELLQDKQSTDLFQNIDLNRIRRFINNSFGGEDNMVEYEQQGKAWDPSVSVKTGIEFNR